MSPVCCVDGDASSAWPALPKSLPLIESLEEFAKPTSPTGPPEVFATLRLRNLRPTNSAPSMREAVTLSPGFSVTIEPCAHVSIVAVFRGPACSLIGVHPPRLSGSCKILTHSSRRTEVGKMSCVSWRTKQDARL